MLKLAVLLAALLAAPAAEAAKQGRWTGTGTSTSFDLTFTVKGSKVVGFRVPDMPAWCQTGFTTFSLAADPGRIRGGKLRIAYRPIEGQEIEITGRFRGSSAEGYIEMRGSACSGKVRWIAQAGPRAPKPARGDTSRCSPTPCGTVEGATLTVHRHGPHAGAPAYEAKYLEPGYRFHVVEVSVRNDTGDRTVHLIPFDFLLVMDDGTLVRATDKRWNCPVSDSDNTSLEAWQGDSPALAKGGRYGPVPVCFEIAGTPKKLRWEHGGDHVDIALP